MKNRIIYIGQRVLFLSFTLLICTYGSAKNKTFKVVCYNIFEGMKADTTSGKKVFADWIKSNDPDVLALQEVNKYTQKSLEEFARSYHHPYAVLLKEPGYPVALTSKFPIINVKKVIDSMHHGFIQAEVNGYNILVLHLSPYTYWKRREEIKLILETISSTKNKKKWIVMGDFNSLSILDKAEYDNGLILKRTEEANKRYSFHDNLVNGQLDFDVQSSILNFGLVDALKVKHTEFISSRPTDKTSANGKNPPSRIDYIYVSKDLKNKIVEVEIIKDSFTNFYSDHYPIKMTLSQK